MGSYIKTYHYLLSLLDDYLFVSGLSPEVLLRKRWTWIWLIVTCIGSVISGFLFLVVFKLWPLWWFAVSFLMGYVVAIPIYRRATRFDLVINILFAYFILITTAVMLQVGGLHSNLGFIFIGFNCALGSVLAGNMRWTIGLFILYCTSILALGILEPLLATPHYVTDSISTATLVFMAIWINACILMLMIFFMKDHERFEQLNSERLKNLDKAKTRLYNSVSHEFRTPLTLIKGVAELIEKEPRKWASRGPARIKSQTEILLRLVNQMLDISKLQANRMPLELSPGDMNAYACYVANAFCGLAEIEGVKLSIEPCEKKIMTAFDRDKVMKVLSNLLSNAIKYTPRDGAVRFQVRLDEVNKTVHLTVCDNGIGIPEESIARIFDQFYQVRDDANQVSGTGLGLTLTYQLVKLMEGDIEVESEWGKGSTFKVTLPLKEAPDSDHDSDSLGEVFEPGPLPEAIHSTIDGISSSVATDIRNGKPILLIVEDNAEVRRYLSEILAGAFTLEFAENGREGLDRAVETIPDIILSDVMMPVMDGFEMIKVLRNDLRTNHIPVVLLTARGDQDSRIEGLEEGADHYLVKPFETDELLLVLNNLLEMRKRLQKKMGSVPSSIKQLGARHRRNLEFLGKVHAILDERLEDPELDISDICSALYMSRAQFYRKFNAVTNTSIGKYIRSYRLRKARGLLETTSKNVTQTALDTGFRNVSHFSTAFKEEFGHSPSELLP